VLCHFFFSRVEFWQVNLELLWEGAGRNDELHHLLNPTFTSQVKSMMLTDAGSDELLCLYLS